MDTTELKQESSASQRGGATNGDSAAGIIGLGLSVAGPFTLGLAAIPALALCIVGIIRKGHRVLASVGLILSLFGVFLLSIWTAPGSIPYPLSIVKYCLNAPAFWVGYDISNLEEAQSQYWLFGGAGGALYFRAKAPSSYKADAVINFASSHGWKFLRKDLYTQEDIETLLDEDGHIRWEGMLDDNAWQDLEQLKGTMESIEERASNLRAVIAPGQFPAWIKKDRTVLSFDTGNEIGAYSHVVINRDGTEMAVYYDGSR